MVELDRDKIRSMSNEELIRAAVELGLVDKKAGPKQALRALEGAAM